MTSSSHAQTVPPFAMSGSFLPVTVGRLGESAANAVAASISADARNGRIVIVQP